MCLALALLASVGCAPTVSPSTTSPAEPSTEPAPGTAVPQPSETSATSPRPADPEPPPPDHFDPAEVPVLTLVGAPGTTGVWSGPVGRPDLAVPIAPPIPETDGAYGPALRLPGGRLVTTFTGPSGGSTLRLLAEGRPPADLLDRVVVGTLGVSPAALAGVARLTTDGADDGAWLVRLPSTEASRVLPADDRALDRGPVAISADGGSVAAATCAGGVQVRFGGAGDRRLPAGVPVGFDPAGNLIALDDCAGATPRRWTADADAGEPMAPAGAGYRALVTSTGRTFAAVSGETLPGQLLVRDLASGTEARLPLAGGAWDLTPDSSDRYLVLLRDDGQGERYAVTWAVADLVEGWIGYLPVDERPAG